ncbi:MAG: homocysteine S-methyltransferase family protein [Eubacteriales bacterium]|nr:homocysteine S-methyltransferase family protein [Eubacteriales bacterium]
MTKLIDSLKERILILDGGFGTAVLSKNIAEQDLFVPGYELKGSNDVLNITRPEIVKEIHTEFLQARADIIETNTFNSNRVSLADYKMEGLVRQLNLEGARLAREAAKEYGAYVAGSVGPTNKSASFPVDFMDSSKRAITPNELLMTYEEQIDALFDGGCDIILIETIFDGLNAKIAIEAAKNVFKIKGSSLPIMISTTVNEGGRLLSGQTIEGLFAAINQPEVISFGLNCSFGCEKMEDFLREINAFSDKFVSFYPNAGLPDEQGNYKDSPKYMADEIRKLAQDGLVNIAGGCCGTTKEHIKAIADALEDTAPRSFIKSDDVKASGIFSVGLNDIKIFDTQASDDYMDSVCDEDYDTAFDMIVDELEDYDAVSFMVDGDDSEKIILTAGARPDVSAKAFVFVGNDAKKIISCNRCVQGRCIAKYTGTDADEVELLKDKGLIIV